MNWLFWNVGVINKRYKRKELRQYLKTKRIKLAGFFETRVKMHNARRISTNIVPGWELQTNYQNATNGRFWLVWDASHVRVHVI